MHTYMHMHSVWFYIRQRFSTSLYFPEGPICPESTSEAISYTDIVDGLETGFQVVVETEMISLTIEKIDGKFFLKDVLKACCASCLKTTSSIVNPRTKTTSI